VVNGRKNIENPCSISSTNHHANYAMRLTSVSTSVTFSLHSKSIQYE